MINPLLRKSCKKALDKYGLNDLGRKVEELANAFNDHLEKHSILAKHEQEPLSSPPLESEWLCDCHNQVCSSWGGTTIGSTGYFICPVTKEACDAHESEEKQECKHSFVEMFDDMGKSKGWECQLCGKPQDHIADVGKKVEAQGDVVECIIGKNNGLYKILGDGTWCKLSPGRAKDILKSEQQIRKDERDKTIKYINNWLVDETCPCMVNEPTRCFKERHISVKVRRETLRAILSTLQAEEEAC